MVVGKDQTAVTLTGDEMFGAFYIYMYVFFLYDMKFCFSCFFFLSLTCCSLTKVVSETSDEHKHWTQIHWTGCARCEGFYKISRKEKLKYLRHTKKETLLPPTNSQVTYEKKNLHTFNF